MFDHLNNNNSDQLDAARDELVALAIEVTPDPMDAISCLFTAGFHLLAEIVGPHHAVGVMRNIVDTIGSRMAN